MLINKEVILDSVEVATYHGESLILDHVALASRPEQKYNKYTNEWEPTGNTCYLWGRLNRNYGNMSHMCYEIRDEHGYNPVDIISNWRLRLNSQGKVWEYFYFDAGGSMTPIKIHIDELERAFRELELI